MNNRRIIVSVKYNNDELELIDELAYKTGRKRSTYIREISLGYKPKEKPPKEFYDVLKELQYLNNNMNQIAAKAHSVGFIDETKYDRDIKSLHKLILDIKKKYLGT